MPGIGLQNLVVLGGLAIMVQERSVESEVYFEDREMFEILLHTVHREHFFNKRFRGDNFGSFCNPALVTILRINLSDPAGISVTGRTYVNLGMEIAELEGLQMILRPLGHDSILDEKTGFPKLQEKGRNSDIQSIAVS